LVHAGCHGDVFYSHLWSPSNLASLSQLFPCLPWMHKDLTIMSGKLGIDAISLDRLQTYFSLLLCYLPRILLGWCNTGFFCYWISLFHLGVYLWLTSLCLAWKAGHSLSALRPHWCPTTVVFILFFHYMWRWLF
jgi:hypothetical protein